MNSRPTGSHLRWVLPLVAVLVIAAGAAAGYGIREVGAEAPPQTGPTSATTTTEPPGPPPGPGTVELSQDAAAHPQAARFQDLLQRHFNAINNRDYDAWASTVVARRTAEMGEDEWQRAYASSRDGSILLNRIEPSASGHVVLLSFTSTQEPESAPSNLPGSECTRWWVSYQVVTERGQPRIDAGIRHTTLNDHCA